jgi:hypothetical protein
MERYLEGLSCCSTEPFDIMCACESLWAIDPSNGAATSTKMANGSPVLSNIYLHCLFKLVFSHYLELPDAVLGFLNYHTLVHSDVAFLHILFATVICSTSYPPSITILNRRVLQNSRVSSCAAQKCVSWTHRALAASC